MREPITRRRFLQGAAVVTSSAALFGACATECDGTASDVSDAGTTTGTSSAGDPSNFAGATLGALTQVYYDAEGSVIDDSGALAVWSRNGDLSRLELRADVISMSIPARPPLEIPIDELDYGDLPSMVRDHFGGVALEQLRHGLLSLQLGV